MNFIKDLAKYIEEENEAVLNYQLLASNAPDELTKRMILRISREEGRHANFLTWILEGHLKEQVGSVEKIKERPIRPKSRVKYNRI